MSIKQFKATTSEYHLLNPQTFEPLFEGDEPVILKLWGPDSRAYKKSIARLQTLGELSEEQRITEDDKIVAAMIAGWSPDSFFEAPFSIENALALVSEEGNLWIAKQINTYTADASNFFTKPSTDLPQQSKQKSSSTTKNKE